MTRIEKAATLLRLCEIVCETATKVGDQGLISACIGLQMEAQKTFDDVLSVACKTNPDLRDYLRFLRGILFDEQ